MLQLMTNIMRDDYSPRLLVRCRAGAAINRAAPQPLPSAPPPIAGQFTVPILMRMTRLRNEWNVGLRDNEERIPSENVMALEDLIARVFLIKFSATF
jgi:hypothetical protein